MKVVAYYGLSLLIDDQLVPMGLSLDVYAAYDSGLLITVIVLGILAEMFRHGVRLQEEQSLTV